MQTMCKFSIDTSQTWVLKWNNLKKEISHCHPHPKGHANLLQYGYTVRRTNLCRSNMVVNKLYSWIQIVYSNQLCSSVPYMYPYCPGFCFSQVKPIKCIHKNGGPAMFASHAIRILLFFQWSLTVLIFTWKENNTNAIFEYSNVPPAHMTATLQRDARYVQFGKRRRRSRRAGKAL